MKLLRLRFQSIFNFGRPVDSSSADSVLKSWLVVDLPARSVMKAGTTVFGNVVGHNAVRVDKSAPGVPAFALVVGMAAPGPTGSVSNRCASSAGCLIISGSVTIPDSVGVAVLLASP